MNAAAGSHGAGAVLVPGPGGGSVLLPAVSQHQLAMPPTHTWSSNPPRAPPPLPTRALDHDDRTERDYDRRGGRSHSRDRSRKRSRRSRSRERRRSRSRSRSSGRADGDWRERARRDRERSRERRGSPRRQQQQRSPSPGGERDWQRDPPNNTIMIRGLPLSVTEQHVQDNIVSHGLHAKDIRLIRKKDTGASRGFAFVEFSTVESAKRWMENQQGWLHFEGCRVSMQYSVPRDQRGYEQPRVLTDWICAKCGVQNFRRREVCFKCAGPRTDYDSTAGDDADEVSSHPTSSVLLSGLDVLTTEDSVLNVLGSLTKLPLKSVRIGRDPATTMSRGVCYVEMNSIVDSMFLHNQLIANPPTIDGRQVSVSYHKQAGPTVVGSNQNQAAAHSALEAAQWTNKSGGLAGTSQQRGKWTEAELAKMAEYSADQYAKTDAERETYVEYYKKFYREGGDTSAAEVALAGVEYTRYPTPDTTKYQYD